MIPTLTRSGLFVAIVASAAVVVGLALSSWALMAAGQLALAALVAAFVTALPTVHAVRHERLEFVWRLPRAGLGSLSPGAPVAIRCRLRNRTSRGFRDARLAVFASAGLEVDLPVGAAISARPGEEVDFAFEVRPRSAGRHFLHGLTLLIVDRAGLVQVHLYFPSTMALAVFPRPAAGRHMPGRPLTGSPLDRAGRHFLRLGGSGTELREIREHRPGDAFRTIDWKATARTGHLMVRQMESEVQGTHVVLLDASATMRAGEHGRRKLDYGVEAASAFARLATERNDRVGLVAFDTRVLAEVEPGEGHAHFLRVQELLVGLFDPVDEDLTDLTDGELVEAVVAHLRHQEGFTLPATREGPYPVDLSALAERAGAAAGPPRRRDRPPARDPRLAELRRYCRERGVPIPYRSDSGFGAKAAGLSAAIEAAAKFRGWVHSLLVVSDLESLGSWEGIDRAFRRLGAGRKPTLVVVPFAPLFVAPTASPQEKRVRTLLTLEEHRRLGDARRRLARHGARVVVASPEDMPALLYARAAARRV